MPNRAPSEASEASEAIASSNAIEASEAIVSLEASEAILLL